MEKIISIEEVYGLKLSHIGTSNERARVGIVQTMNALFGSYGSYDGYKIKTSEHEYLILIDNGQCCCESWGYFSSDDDFARFIGKKLLSVECTDTALNTQKVEETAPSPVLALELRASGLQRRRADETASGLAAAGRCKAGQPFSCRLFPPLPPPLQ